MERGIDQLVTIRMEEEYFGIPIMLVHEIIFVPKLTSIARTPDSIIGVMNLRGKLIPVIDLRLLFARPKGEVTRRQRIVVTESRGRIIGLLVDEVTEVTRIQKGELEAVPDALRTEYTSYIDSIYRMDDQVIILLQMDQLLNPVEMTYIHHME